MYNVSVARKSRDLCERQDASEVTFESGVASVIYFSTIYQLFRYGRGVRVASVSRRMNALYRSS